MNALITRKRILDNRLGRIEALILQHGDHPLEAAAARVQLDLLESVGTDFQNLEEETLIRLNNAEYDIQQREFAEIMQRFAAAKATLLTLAQPLQQLQHLQQQQQAQAQPDNNNINNMEQRIVEVRLPKLPLPTFSGNILDWPSFYDRFTAAIHTKDIPPSLKFEYLVSCLVGEAAEAVKNIPITDANYMEAWELLSKRYNNKRKIAKMHVDRLLSVPSVGHDIGEGLRRLFNCTNESIRALRVMELPVQHWDVLVCTIITEKLDCDTRRQWELTMDDNEYPELQNFLEKQAKSFEIASNSTLNRQLEEGKCLVCNEFHYIMKCPKFLAASTTDRRQMLQKLNACLNCFRIGHATKFCTRQKCKICDGLHHTLLHEEKSG